MAYYQNFTFEPKNVPERVYLGLLTMLFEGSIVPGQKLQYEDIAARFQVSRTPVKEAFQMMSKEGYLTLHPNKGFYVAEIHPKEIADLYELRVPLELLAVRKAVEKQNSEALAILRTAIENHAEDTTKTISRHRLIMDTEVHLAIATMSQNEQLYRFLSLIFSKLYLKIKVENLSKNRSAVAMSEHWEIYHAIEAREAATAEKKIYEHIMRSMENDLQAQSYLQGNGNGGK